MCSVLCTLHVILCTKCEFLQLFQNRIFTQWRRKLKNFEGDGDENFGVKGGGLPLKTSSVMAHLFTAYGELCYFSLFFFPFFIFLPNFLPPWNFRGTSPTKNFRGKHVPRHPRFHRLCFHHKNVRRIKIHLDRRVRKNVKLCRIKSKVNSPLKMSKLFQFQNSVFPTVFNGCCG